MQQQHPTKSRQWLEQYGLGNKITAGGRQLAIKVKTTIVLPLDSLWSASRHLKSAMTLSEAS